MKAQRNDIAYVQGRTGVNGATETFTYDRADRLINVNGSSATTITYAPNGNITSKSNVGSYSYSSSKPHAVTSVVDSTKTPSVEAQNITYTPFNKVQTITQADKKLTITYGPDQQRVKTIYTSGKTTQTRIYAGDFERLSQNGTTTSYLYIYSPDGLVGIYVKPSNGTAEMHYAVTDHLGSLLALYKSNFTQTYAASYDAWGKQTISKSTLNLRRGYCQHEHWNEFDLIDMNGRFYDPLLGRFLSPDPYVQDSTNPQNFNRYSYCLNNPLKYTDPSGMKQVINNDAMPYKELDNGIRFHAPTIPYHTSRRSNGGYGYGGSYGSYGGYGSSPVSYDGFGYTLYDPKTINEFYASGMSLSDWIDQMVYEDKAIYTKMLDEVTVRAYDQSSYNRAAIDIWAQVHYGDYSGGWWQLGQSFASGDGVVSGRGSGGGKTVVRSTSAKLSGPDAAGVQISFAFYVGMGASIDVLIGENRNGRHFLSVNLNAGIGLDLGMGAGIFTSYYSHGENSPLNIYPTTMEGRGKYIGGGMGLSYNYSSSDITDLQEQRGKYDHWTTNSFLIVSPRLGGSMGISKTYVPVIR